MKMRQTSFSDPKKHKKQKHHHPAELAGCQQNKPEQESLNNFECPETAAPHTVIMVDLGI